MPKKAFRLESGFKQTRPESTSKHTCLDHSPGTPLITFTASLKMNLLSSHSPRGANHLQDAQSLQDTHNWSKSRREYTFKLLTPVSSARRFTESCTVIILLEFNGFHQNRPSIALLANQPADTRKRHHARKGVKTLVQIVVCDIVLAIVKG